MFKSVWPVILFDMFLNPSFKMRASFTNIARTTASLSKFIRLDLILSMWLWREFQLLQIFSDPSIKHLIKLILYENDVKLLKLRRRPISVDLWYVRSVSCWFLLIPEMNISRKAMAWWICFSMVNLILGYLFFKRAKKKKN